MACSYGKAARTRVFAGLQDALVTFSLSVLCGLCSVLPMVARGASDAAGDDLTSKVVRALRTEEAAPRDVLLSPADCQDADTDMSLPLALYLRDRLQEALELEGLQVRRPAIGMRDFWLLQCRWRRKDDHLAVTFTANLWTDGKRQRALVVPARLDLDAEILGLLEPDLASFGRTLVHRLALDDKLTAPRRVYLRPLQVSAIVGGKRSNDFFDDWLRQAIEESNLLVAVDAEKELAALDRSSLRRRGIRPSPGLSLGADLVDAENELSGEVAKKEDQVEVATVLHDQGRTKVAEASVTLPIAMLPAAVVADLEASPGQALAAGAPVSRGGLHVELATTRGEGKADYRVGEKIVFLVRVDRDAFVYLFDLDADGGATLLYPALGLAETALPAGRELLLPDDGMPYDLDVTPPLGRDLVWVVAADKPLAVPSPLEGDWARAQSLLARVRLLGEALGAYAEAQVVIETLPGAAPGADPDAGVQGDLPAGTAGAVQAGTAIGAE